MNAEEAKKSEESLDETYKWRQRYYDRIALRPDLLELISKLIDERKLQYRKPRNIRERRAAHKRNLKRYIKRMDIPTERYRVLPERMIRVLGGDSFRSRPDAQSILSSLRRQLFTGVFSLFALLSSALRTAVGKKKLADNSLRSLDDDFMCLWDFYNMIDDLHRAGFTEHADGLRIAPKRIRIIYELLEICDKDGMRSTFRSIHRIADKAFVSESPRREGLQSQAAVEGDKSREDISTADSNANREVPAGAHQKLNPEAQYLRAEAKPSGETNPVSDYPRSDKPKKKRRKGAKPEGEAVELTQKQINKLLKEISTGRYTPDTEQLLSSDHEPDPDSQNSMKDRLSLDDRQVLILRQATDIFLQYLRNENSFPYAIFHRWYFNGSSYLLPLWLRRGSPPDQVVFEVGKGLAYMTTSMLSSSFLRNVHDDGDLVKAIYGETTEYTHQFAWRTLAEHVSKWLSVAWGQFPAMPALTVTNTIQISQVPDLPGNAEFIEISFSIEDVFGQSCMLNVYYDPRLFDLAGACL